jgi:RNA polymerase sigma-70 factor (ECF subfamily)
VITTSIGAESPGRPEALSDEEVVGRIRAGEPALFEILMRRYNQRIYRVARAIVRDDSEAEDVMQQAYVNAYTHLDQFAGRAKFSTWLSRIATYEAYARVRRRRRVTETDTMRKPENPPTVVASDEIDPERQAYGAELRRALEGALESLPEIYRSAFVLRDVEGLSTAEAAECLDVSEDVVKTRLSRARALLREELFATAGLAAGDVFSFHAVRCDRVVERVFAELRIVRPTLH